MKATIDLDQVIEQIDPVSVTLKIGGRDYPVRRISLAEARRLDQMFELVGDPPAEGQPDTRSAKYTDAQNVEFLASLFDGEAPASLTAPLDPADGLASFRRNQLMLLIQGALLEAYVNYTGEDGSKKHVRGIELIRQQLTRAGRSSGTGSPSA